MSVCFHRMPKSSSWMQIAFGTRAGLARVVGHGRVQVGDLAQAVATELELVDELADQVLAGVEVRLPVAEPRAAVGYDHIRDRGPVMDRVLLPGGLAVQA